MKNLRYIIQEAEQSKLQKEYEEYFTKLLDKYGVKSPADLSEEEKKKFFDEVQKGWTKGTGAKATNESKDEEEEDEKVEDIDPKVKKDGDTAKDAHKEMEEEEEEEVTESRLYKKLEEKISAAGIKRAMGLVPTKAVAAMKEATWDIFDVLREDGFDDEDIKDFISYYIDMNIDESTVNEANDLEDQFKDQMGDIADAAEGKSPKELSKLQKEYADYFKKILDKYNVGSPAELSEDEKKKFFDEVKKGWTKGKGEK